MVAALFAAASAFGQGQVFFANRVAAAGIDARVAYAGGGFADGRFVAQLQYQNPTTQAWTGVGTPITFRDTPEAGTGYWAGAVVDVPAEAGASATVRVVAWASANGATYEAAAASGLGGTGLSNTISVSPAAAPNLPPDLVGLTAFPISQIVPEPSIAALGLLGAGLLLIRRKK